MQIGKDKQQLKLLLLGIGMRMILQNFLAKKNNVKLNHLYIMKELSYKCKNYKVKLTWC